MRPDSHKRVERNRVAEVIRVPIVKYFVCVGSALVALLFIANWCLPERPAFLTDQSQVDKTILRIKSERKWPEKVVLDTTRPAILAPFGETMTSAPPGTIPADDATETPGLEALAQLKPDERQIAHDLTIVQVRRKVARARDHGRLPRVKSTKT
jgi:hypothetical protein